MLRALWTWQRWIGVWRPKVLRIALDSALAPSMMNRRQTAGSRPRPTRLSSSACHHGGILGRPLDHAEGMLIAVAIDADGGQQHQVLIDVDAVQFWMISRSRLDRSAAIHRFMRSADNATNRRDTADLDTPRSLRRGHVALRQADGAAELARRDVDQHQVERPLAQQVLRQRRLPARQGDLVAVAGTHAGPLDLDLAAMEADLPRGLAPAVPVPSVSAAVAGTAHPGRILLQHAGQSRKAGRQAEALEARSNLLPGIFDDCRRDNSSRCGRFSSWRCFPFVGFSTPSLPAQGEQRLLHIFNRDRDISMTTAKWVLISPMGPKKL